MSSRTMLTEGAAALTEVAKELNTTQTITNLSLAFYLLAMAFTPIWW
jgi:hypothetical protein